VLSEPWAPRHVSPGARSRTRTSPALPPELHLESWSSTSAVVAHPVDHEAAGVGERQLVSSRLTGLMGSK